MEYLLLHREDDGQLMTEGEWQIVRVSAPSAEFAVREALTDEEILTHQYYVCEIIDEVDSEEFHNIGTFDDIAEEYE